MYNNFLVEFTNERIIPSGGLAVVGATFGNSDFVKRMNRMDVAPNHSQHQFKNDNVLLTYIGILSWNSHSTRPFTKWMTIWCFTRRCLTMLIRSFLKKPFVSDWMTMVRQSARKFLLKM